MERVGDDQAGFSLNHDAMAGALRVAGWGFWSVPVALAFADTVLDALRRRAGTAGVVLDMSELKPMREEGQHSFGRLLRELPLSVSRVSIVTSNPLTKLQLVRLVTESGARAKVHWSSEGAGSGRGV